MGPKVMVKWRAFAYMAQVWPCSRSINEPAILALLYAMVVIEEIPNRFSTVCIKANHSTPEHVIDTRDPLDFRGCQSWRDALEALKLH